MKILCFAGSLRKGSFNKKYVQVARQMLAQKKNFEINYVDLLDYQMPVFSQDIEEAGVPQAVQELAALIRGSDAVVISTPEYNASIPGPLKNTIDWLSRKPHNPWPGKQVLLIGASPGNLGATRSLMITRLTLEELGCHVYPGMSGLPRAHEAFDEAGQLKDSTSQQRLSKLVNEFTEYLGS